MKKIIFTLVALLVVSSSVGVVVFASAVKQGSIDSYSTVEHVNYDKVLDSDTPTIYYYYQDTCHYCNTIKDQVFDFLEITEQTPNLDFKFVDMKSDYNKVVWSNTGIEPTLEEMKTAEDIKIVGTPTMIYVKDGEVVDYEIGDGIFDLLETVEEEYDIDYKFDRSRYGKE